MVPKEKLITSSADETVLDAMKKCVSENISAIIIVSDPDTAVGIVTSDDLMRILVEKGADGFDVKLQDIMTKELVTVKEEDQLNPSIQKLESVKKHHLVVVDDGGNLAGILSSYDIVRERSLDIRSHPWIRK